MQITSVIISSFRQDFPAFADETKWPESVVTMAMNEAAAETGGAGWGVYQGDDPQNFKRRGLFYFCAHWLSSFYGSNAKDPGKVNPVSRLNTSGKSVGDESVQYRITEMENTGNDWLGTTIYGQMYWKLKRRASMGARAV